MSLDAPLTTDDSRVSAGSGLLQHSGLLVGLLWGAALTLDLAVITYLRTSGADWPNSPGVVAMGLSFAQTGLAAVLLGLGGGPLWLRAMLAVPLYGLAACVGCHAARHHAEHLPLWFVIMLVVGAVVAAPLVVARLAGVGIAPAGQRELPAGSRQFTILGVLALTTIVAMLMGLARRFDFPWHEIGDVALFALALGGIPWVGATIPLSRFSWPAAALLMSAYCPLAGWLLSRTGFPPPDVGGLIAMCYVAAAVTIAAAAVFRIAGFRLVWPTP